MRGPGDGILFNHWTEALDLWAESRWPNFRPDEKARDGRLSLACPHCGEFYFDEWMLDGLQFIRHRTSRPVSLNSGHRCRIHNLRVGGAEYSRHLRLAFDISTQGHDLAALHAAAQDWDFGAFGFYGTFLHVDDRPGRRWFTKEGRKTWNFLLT